MRPRFLHCLAYTHGERPARRCKNKTNHPLIRWSINDDFFVWFFLNKTSFHIFCVRLLSRVFLFAHHGEKRASSCDPVFRRIHRTKWLQIHENISYIYLLASSAEQKAERQKALSSFQSGGKAHFIWFNCFQLINITSSFNWAWNHELEKMHRHFIIEIDSHKVSLLCNPRRAFDSTRLDSAIFMFSLSLEGFKKRRSNLIALDTASDLLLSSLSRLSWRTFPFMWTGENWFKCCRFSFSISSRNWLPTISGFSLFLLSTVYHNWTTDGLNRRSKVCWLSVFLCNFSVGMCTCVDFT